MDVLCFVLCCVCSLDSNRALILAHSKKSGVPLLDVVCYGVSHLENATTCQSVIAFLMMMAKQDGESFLILI
jgi:hypothetical protein